MLDKTYNVKQQGIALDNHVAVECFLSHNLGDDLFIITLAYRYPSEQFYVLADDSYSSLFHEITNLHIIKKNKNTTRFFPHAVQRFLAGNQSFKQTLHLIRGAKVYVNIGGSIFMQHSRSIKMLDNLLLARFFSRERRKYSKASHSFILGANFGPFDNPKYLFGYQNIFSNICTDVCFRDYYSKQLFSKINNVHFAPDILFATKFPDVKKKKQVFISPVDLSNKDKFRTDSKYEKDYTNWLLKVVDWCSENKYDIVLCSFCEAQGDGLVVDRLAKIAGSKHTNIKTLHYLSNYETILRYIAESEIVVGTRFHASILGLASGAKVLPIIYSEKTRHVLQDIGYPESDMLSFGELKHKGMSVLKDIVAKSAFNVSKQIREAENQFAALDEQLANKGLHI